MNEKEINIYWEVHNNLDTYQKVHDLLNKILNADLSFIDNEIFSDINKVKELFTFKMSEAPSWRTYDALESSLKASNKKNVLTSDQEQKLFLQYNYARSKVIEKRNKHLNCPEKENLIRLIKWYNKAQEIKSIIASYNMRLISNLMKKWANQRLDNHELFSEGQMAILNAIDGFDTSVGKFSTYAYWAISHAFGKTNKIRTKHNAHISSSVDEENVDVIDDKNDDDLAYKIEALQKIIENNRADLSNNELDIIRMRYLNSEGKRPSVEKVSDKLGLKKHQVSSSEKKALGKIRCAFNRDFLDNDEKIVPKSELNAIISRTSEKEDKTQGETKMNDEQSNVETPVEDVAEPVETPVEAPVETPVETPKAEKKVLYKIQLDAEGNEVSRKPMTRGRPPRNSHKDDNGNLVCPHVEPIVVAKANSDYITIDAEGNVLHREPRKPGRGRPKKGFVKQIEGDHVGDYVKIVIADETPAETPADETPVVASQEAPEVVVPEPVEKTEQEKVEDEMLA